MPGNNSNSSIEVKELSCEACLKIISATETEDEITANFKSHFCNQECYDEWKSHKLSESPDFDPNFLKGIYFLWEAKYKQAREYFLLALMESNPLESNHEIYLSYLSLSGVLIDKQNEVLQHTSHSSHFPLTLNPEIQLNQACTELLKGNRKQGVLAINKAKKFKLSAQNSQYIQSFFNIIGKRKQDRAGILKRNRFIHKTIGKLFRKRKGTDIQKIEIFVRDMAKSRYQNALSDFSVTA